MSVALTGRAPFRKVLGYEKMLDEHGQEMHGSWGNMIDAEDAFARMGADVMRWQYCAQPPDRNLLFGFGPAQEIKRRLLTLWNSAKFLADYGAIESFRPTYADLERRRARRRPAAARPLARRADGAARRGGDRRATSAGSRSTCTRAFEAYVDDLSNWYIRRSRRRFWDGDEAALRTLWFGARPGAARDRAGDAVPRRAPVAGARRRRRRRTRRRRCSSPAGPRRARPTRACSPRSRELRTRRRARPPGALGGRAEAAPAAAPASSSRARRSPRPTPTRSPRSCA